MFCLTAWRHKWEKWKTISIGVLLRGPFDRLTGQEYPPEDRNMPIGKYEVQRRECENCGKSELRETRT